MPLMLASHEKARREVPDWDVLFRWAEEPRPDTEFWFVAPTSHAMVNGPQLAPERTVHNPVTQVPDRVKEIAFLYKQPHVPGLFGAFEEFFPYWFDLTEADEIRITLRDFMSREQGGFVLPKRIWTLLENFARFGMAQIKQALDPEKGKAITGKSELAEVLAALDPEKAEKIVIRKGFYSLTDAMMMMAQFRENAFRCNSLRKYYTGEQLRLEAKSKLDGERARIEADKKIRNEMEKMSAAARKAGRPDFRAVFGQ